MEILGLLALVGYLVVASLSPVLALAVVLLARRRSVTSALGTVVGTLAATLTLAVTVVAALVSPWAALWTVLVGVSCLVGLVVVPLLVGRSVVVRWRGHDRETALRYAVMGWPLALAVGSALFFAPGGPGRYNITFLSGPAAVVAWLAWGALVLLGPGVVGAGLSRVFERVS